MKKAGTLGVIAVIIVMIALVACGKKADPAKQPAGAVPSQSDGKTASAEPLPFDDGAAHAADSPEKVVCDFMAAWRDADFQSMAKNSLGSWVANDGTPVDTLRDYFSAQKLTGFKLVSVQPKSDSEKVVKCELWAVPEGGKAPGKATVDVAVAREAKWGVNPVALSAVQFK